MGNVESRPVAPEDADIRLDRWFKRHYPALGHGRLEKLLRTGQIRVDGNRANAGLRVAAGQIVRVPPLGNLAPLAPRTTPLPPNRRDVDAVLAAILHRDDHVIVIDKPAGLAVQGGTATDRHLDATLDALKFGGERPRLVHRLDKDTSGVLVLARSAEAARKLAAAFRDKDARKIYWAAVVGLPKPRQGRIEMPLSKLSGPAGERVVEDEEDGKRAITDYRVIANAGDKISWVALSPLTGRTHQLRAHMAALGTPILGDGKYGGAASHPTGVPDSRKLHLHARAIALPHPGGGVLRAEAKLPAHMKRTWEFLGFDEGDERDPFAGFGDEE